MDGEETAVALSVAKFFVSGLLTTGFMEHVRLIERALTNTQLSNHRKLKKALHPPKMYFFLERHSDP